MSEPHGQMIDLKFAVQNEEDHVFHVRPLTGKFCGDQCSRAGTLSQFAESEVLKINGIFANQNLDVQSSVKLRSEGIEQQQSQNPAVTSPMTEGLTKSPYDEGNYPNGVTNSVYESSVYKQQAPPMYSQRVS